MNLPYLLASLPHLMFETPAPLRAEAFLTACREQLSEDHAKTAVALLRGEPNQTPCARAWTEYENDVRDAVAKRRLARKKVAGASCSQTTPRERDVPATLLFEIESAFQSADPLARDTALDRLRWRKAEEMEGLDPMSRDALFAYAVKLRISLRRAAMTREAGLAALDTICGTPLPAGVAGLEN